jgi:hypothetical protein
MRDKQNPAAANGGTSPAEDGQSPREQSGEMPRSYYYDDATGYEIYKDEDDAVTDEQIDSGEDESQT